MRISISSPRDAIHTFVRCKPCADRRGASAPLEVGIAKGFVMVCCREHGRVLLIDQPQFSKLTESAPRCDIAGCEHADH